MAYKDVIRRTFTRVGLRHVLPDAAHADGILHTVARFIAIPSALLAALADRPSAWAQCRRLSSVVTAASYLARTTRRLRAGLAHPRTLGCKPQRLDLPFLRPIWLAWNLRNEDT